jgi:hypothetical protein
MNNKATDASMMNTHDTAWGGMNIFNESRSIIVDEEHSYIYDEQENSVYNYFEVLVPGQPQVFLLGEFQRRGYAVHLHLLVHPPDAAADDAD